MKILAMLLGACGLLAAQGLPNGVAPVIPSTVTVSITVDSKTYTVTLTDAAKTALANLIAATTQVTKDDNGSTLSTTPLYADIGVLLINHVVNTLVIPNIVRFQTTTAVQSAADAIAAAQASAKASIAAAAQGTVTVH